MGKKPTERWMNEKKCLDLQTRFGDYETYEETGGGRGENKQSIIRVLKELVNRFDNKPSILEIGSGPGHFLWVMKDLGSSITGVDNSPHMIKISEEVFKENNNINFINGSCWELPLISDSYDLVFQVDVCMHVGGSFESILEMIRVSKKYIVFTGPSFEDLKTEDMDKQIGKNSWAINNKILNKELDKLISKGKIKKYYYKIRPKTQVYKHQILVIEK